MPKERRRFPAKESLGSEGWPLYHHESDFGTGEGNWPCGVVVSKVEAGTWPRATLDSDETTGRSRFCRSKVSATDQLAVDH
jgi:hypothetical protein